MSTFDAHDVLVGTAEKLPDAFSSLGIQFHYYLDKQGTLSWTSLSGVGKKKMLSALPIASLFPNDPSRGLRVQALWRSFYELYEIYSSANYSFQGKVYSPAEYSQKAASWLLEFTAPSTGDPDQPNYKRGMYSDSSVTPYIHGVVVHMPQMMVRLQQYGFSLQLFSCHSLEKKNHSQTSDVFRCTLKSGCSSSVHRDLLKRELVLFFAFHDCNTEGC